MLIQEREESLSLDDIATSLLSPDETFLFWFGIIILSVTSEIMPYFLGALAKLQKATVSFIMFVWSSVCLSIHLSTWNSSAPAGQIFMKFNI